MKQLYIDFKKAILGFDKLALIFVLLKFTTAVGFIPVMIPEIVSYGVLLLMAILAMTKMQKPDRMLMVMVAYLAVNVVVCHPPVEFNSWMRLALFVVLLVSCSSLLQSEQLRLLRKDMLMATLWITAVLSVGSFFCRFLGINFMFIPDIEDLSYNTAGLFGGLFNQSMMLGPVAGAASVFMAYKAYCAPVKKSRQWYTYMALMCLAAVLFSASRSSLLCAMAGILVMLQKATGGRGRFLRLMTIVLLVGAITFPLWGSLTDGIVEKQRANEGQFTSLAGSREQKWGARTAEFMSSPIVGIGFSSVDSRLDVVGDGGVVEPGTSWLCILSMTGIVGFVLFFSIFYKAYKACNRMRRKEDALYLGLLALFAVHMVAEGYVFAAGGFLCFILWLVIGCCYDRSYEND